MNYWLLKSEPECYSIDDLKRDKTTFWDGVRNYQARNFMTQEMKVGDLAFFYHSNADPSGIAGIAKIVKPATPDLTALDPNEDHYDPKATVQKPIWYGVTLEYVNSFNKIVTLKSLHSYPELKNMIVLQKGSRLSVMPVTKDEFEFVKKLGQQR